jgi:hypothetical protein
MTDHIRTTRQLADHVKKIIAAFPNDDYASVSDFAIGHRMGYLAVQILCQFRKPEADVNADPGNGTPSIVALLREKSLMQMFATDGQPSDESTRGSIAAFTNLLDLCGERVS